MFPKFGFGHSATTATATQYRWSCEGSASRLFHDVRLGTVDEPQNFGALSSRYRKSVKGGLKVNEEGLPVALTDAHPAVRGLHVAADVIERPAGRRAQEVDQQLLFPPHAVVGPVLPEPGELGIRHQPDQQIVGYRR